MSALLNVKQFVRFDEHGNLHVPNKLFVACQAYVQTPFLNDTSSRVATTEWVRAQIVGLTNVPLSETDPIWIFEKALYYTKVQADARYLQSFTETDPTVSAWAKASVKPTYTFAELLSKPTTIAGYGITDIPTTLPASDVYAWAKAATKPSYAYSEITGLPALFSGSYTDLTNKPTIPTYTLSGLGGQPLDADLTAIAALAGTAGFLKKTAADTWALDNNTYLTSYTETDPIWTAEKTNYALKTYVDTSISNLVASAPAALDTLNELALALGSDASFSTTVTTLIGTKATDSAVVHLAGTETITGYKTFDAALELKYNVIPTPSSAGYIGIGSNGVGITITTKPVSTVYNNNFYFASASNTFTFPNATGTIALTSNIPSITGLVPYTGATASVALGNFDLSSNNISVKNALYINGDTYNGAIVLTSNKGGLVFSTTNAINISPASVNLLDFTFGQSNSTVKNFRLDASSLTTGLLRTYVMPNSDGTLALTSNIPTLSGLSGVPTSRTLTINGTAYDLSADRAWTITTASTYTLPNASTTVLGGIKVGTNLSIDVNGVLSSTDTNTTYVNFTRTVAGLVPNPGAATTNRYLREDGTWVIPPDTDTDTVYVHPTTAGNKHIPAGGAAGQILRWSADGAATWGADVDTDTTYVVFTRSANGLAPAAPTGTGTTKYLREDGTWQVPPDTDTDTNTWNANTKTVAGYVSAPGDVANKVWKTDGSGNPGWRDDADTDTNTTYTASTGLTLTGTAFSITDTITTAATANTIAKRDGSAVISAGGFYQTSSKTLKTSIIDYNESALDIINKINVVSFYYKADVKNKRIGFIAEDSPEEVATIDHNVMDTNSTVGLLLKAIQQLEARIKVLENV